MSADLVKIFFELVQDDDGHPPASVESLWAAPTPREHEYILDNVPFLVRDATIGDVVRAREEDGRLWFEAVVDRSNASLIRVVFFDESERDRINRGLVALGCSTEYAEAYRLLAVSVPGDVDLSPVQDFLRVEEAAGHVDYEEAILSR